MFRPAQNPVLAISEIQIRIKCNIFTNIRNQKGVILLKWKKISTLQQKNILFKFGIDFNIMS